MSCLVVCASLKIQIFCCLKTWGADSLDTQVVRAKPVSKSTNNGCDIDPKTKIIVVVVMQYVLTFK